MRDWIILDCAPLEARLMLDRAPAEEKVEAACRRLGVARERLLSGDRKRSLAWARQDIMRELRAEGWSLLRIARYFDMHHTAVMHGLKAAAGRASRRLIHSAPGNRSVDQMSHVKQDEAA